MLILGCGYTGCRLAAHLIGEGQTVTGTVRSEAREPALAAAGVTPLILDLDASDQRPDLSAHTQIFYLAPPPNEGHVDPRVTRFLDLLSDYAAAPHLVYVSTTGVYGDCRGEWVDETRCTNPSTDRARRRQDAEDQLRAWRNRSGASLVILRVAGIYGPGRLPLDRLRAGAPILRAADAPWSNRIHVDDLVSICAAAMDFGRDGEIYNVSDGAPGTMTKYFNAVADAAKLPRPPQISMAEAREVLPAGLLSYLSENRRIDNRKMLRELELELRYPDVVGGVRGSL